MGRAAASTAPRSRRRAQAPAVRRPAPRRVSGPAAGAGAVALPGRVLRGPFAQAARARAGTVLDALLQGRAWIALVAVLLVGIVFFNVDLLQMNRDIAHTAEKASRVSRENAVLRLQVARLASSERIQRVAAGRGLELPAPGDVRYLRLHPGVDARRAAARMIEPGSGSAAPVTSGASAPALPTSTPSIPTPTAPQPGAQSPAPSTQSATSPPTSATPTGPSPATPQNTSPLAAGGATPAATGTGG
jgi:cell division protein FtsL